MKGEVWHNEKTGEYGVSWEEPVTLPVGYGGENEVEGDTEIILTEAELMEMIAKIHQRKEGGA